jgi:hypothetical protein
MARITVEGVGYPVVDKGMYSHDLGSYWKVVRTPEGERMVVGRAGRWRFRTARERVQPLLDAVADGWPKEKRGND